MRLATASQMVAETATAEAHVECAALTRSFPAVNGTGELPVLGPISLSIRRGEFFSVIGPSGCGKSTFMDVLAGLTTPTGGTVRFEDKPVVGGTVPDGIGAVFQQDASLPWLSVWENIAFGLRRRGTDPVEIKRLVDYALGFMGLTPFAHAYPNQLSGGMRQRTCIARTLVMKPRLILLDEPFAALDAQTRLLMGDELLRLWRETNATVVLITHALDEAAMLSDRVGAMSARPGRFIELIETGWSRDRDSTIVSDPGYGALSSRLWSVLRKESMKALDHSLGTEKE
ncbi:nitrate/sulfonate/bicarbonate ABC transporter ATP-binding protein [Azospirillum palustre]|uniref:Nitrate/sulfonate/bicarbonate ABC transporter ATP-binding protein n=1 Tax=Azospirillum palustre TaxID=2044885 RepID=A0A2B8BN13_9PROT|nr:MULTISPECIES: ABC transporter ATP-binding protein [Azospirillum]MDR6775571.1 NitT/TauT family transport system ATP-binding protein [Azospirillum sp. BE72]PGH59119.1 nitrate/sulfonate/bicarbonate ABC transporter ATP-binding protein [Azospirillum palustre]